MLFNYGGGIRGIVPAIMMSHIEEQTGLRMADMVDVFSGPSTGAILNTALNVPHPDDKMRPKYRARHLVKFYEREGRNIFPPDRFRAFRALLHDFNNRTMKISQLKSLMRHGHYDPSYLGRSLRRLLGETHMSETLKSLIIPFYNIDDANLMPLMDRNETESSPVHTRNNLIEEGGHAIWIKNMKENHGFQKTAPCPDISMFDAVMGSTAAPTYFPCHDFYYDRNDGTGAKHVTAIDGSIFDNPCITYHGALSRHVDDDTKIIPILLGTGYSLKAFSKAQWNSYGSIGVVDPAHDLPLINILFHAPESALIDSFFEEMGRDMFVFNKSIIKSDPSMRPTLQIDDATPENIINLKKFAACMIEEQAQDIDRLCNLLVHNYEQNAVEKTAQVKDKRRIFSFFSK